MDNEAKKEKCHHPMHSSSNAVYGLGLIGAAIYFISKAKGFWMISLACLKALVWPVFLVYGALKFLGL